MKTYLIPYLTLILISCGSIITSAQKLIDFNTIKVPSSSTIEKTIENEDAKYFSEGISEINLKTVLYDLADDKFEGRRTGEKGQKLAAEYLIEFYKNLGISAADPNGNYLQNIPMDFFRGQSSQDSENVVAYLKGSEKPDEYIIISAHYDHVGIKGEKIYNGADDDASGTSAVLIIAEAFKKALNSGNGPKRSIVFLHFTGEEMGLMGSRYYSENPIFPLENTVANLNIDMIGRVDKKHIDNPEFIYLIGADKISKELHEISESVNEKYTKLTLDYTYNDENDPNRFYYRSDHYNFAKNGIPIIFYFNGVHEDYHKHTDTPDKIRYDLLQKRAQLVFHTAWELANKKNRLVLDQK